MYQHVKVRSCLLCCNEQAAGTGLACNLDTQQQPLLFHHLLRAISMPVQFMMYDHPRWLGSRQSYPWAFAINHRLDMLSHLQLKKRLQEFEARWFFQQLIIGLDYCHKVNQAVKLLVSCRQAIAVPVPSLDLLKSREKSHGKPPAECIELPASGRETRALVPCDVAFQSTLSLAVLSNLYQRVASSP